MAFAQDLDEQPAPKVSKTQQEKRKRAADSVENKHLPHVPQPPMKRIKGKQSDPSGSMPSQQVDRILAHASQGQKIKRGRGRPKGSKAVDLSKADRQGKATSLTVWQKMQIIQEYERLKQLGTVKHVESWMLKNGKMKGGYQGCLSQAKWLGSREKYKWDEFVEHCPKLAKKVHEVPNALLEVLGVSVPSICMRNVFNFLMYIVQICMCQIQILLLICAYAGKHVHIYIRVCMSQASLLLPEAGKWHQGRFQDDGVTHSIPAPLAVAFEKIILGRQLLGEENDSLFGQNLLHDLINVWNKNIKQLREDLASSAGAKALQELDEQDPNVAGEEVQKEASAKAMDALKETLAELKIVKIEDTSTALKSLGCNGFCNFQFNFLSWKWPKTTDRIFQLGDVHP